MSGICSYPRYDERGEPAEQREVHENVLSKEDISALEAAVPVEEVEGERYSAGGVEFEKDKNQALAAEEAEKYGLTA